jgi:hypothetical protein
MRDRQRGEGERGVASEVAGDATRVETEGVGEGANIVAGEG